MNISQDKTSKTMDTKYYFCKAKIRPNCLLETNLCCAVCTMKIECISQKQKVTPCDLDENEDCEFLI